jgi:ADP-ribosyl-[dinitrogen reductase] hydrolase
MSQEYMKELMRDYVRGCLVGVAIGDAFGMPWETYTAEEILAATNGKGVEKLEEPPNGERKWQDMRSIQLGHTTDDWQLTRAVADSLIRRKDFDIYDQAAAHIEAYETSTRGWGGSTRGGIGAIKLWWDSRGREGRSPVSPFDGKHGAGLGDGVLMKLAPIACMEAIIQLRLVSGDPFDMIEESVEKLHKLTHSNEVLTESLFLAFILYEILAFGEVGSKPHQASVADLVLVRNGIQNSVLRVFTDPEILKRVLNGGPETLRALTGVSCLAKESLPFVVGTFLRHPANFRDAVLEAINAGGDTDTNASIVGALVGANVGFSRIPSDMFEVVADARVAFDVADKLCDAFFPDDENS